ncbi:MAG: ATP-binding protein [Lachnospiraceae bacterium]|nr:ATP-binding protein [Lachnospiraceae bacterium]
MSLNNGQYNQIMRVYEARQRKSRLELDSRRQRIYEAIPRLVAYDAAINEAAADLARAALRGVECGRVARQRLDDLREERDLLITTGGFTKADLELKYICPSCRDTGYVDGKKCRCFKQQEIALLYRESGLEKQLEKENFDTMTDRYYDPAFAVNRESGLMLPEYMARVAGVCRQYTEDFGEKGGNLLFTGPAGVGKTFFTHCIAKALIEQSVSVVYVTASQLMDTMTGARMSDGSDPETEIRAQLIDDCELLIIDDLGTELNNSMTNAELFRCLDSRLKKGQATVISTNLSVNELRDTYADRIASRILSEYRIIRFYGPDIRIRKNYG